MAELDWLLHDVVPVKEVLAKLETKEESPVSAFVNDLKKLRKRASWVFHVAGAEDQKKMVGRLTQLFIKNKLTGKYSVRKELENGAVYLYRRSKKNGGSK